MTAMYRTDDHFQFFFFFFNDTATTEIYTLSLHDALPISRVADRPAGVGQERRGPARGREAAGGIRGHRRDRRAARGAADRKSTRLNSSHSQNSYAGLCLEKKKKYRALTSTNNTAIVLRLS